MQRRKFMQQSALASASILAASSVKANNPQNNSDTFTLNYAIHDGMFAETAGKDFLDQIQFAYDNGFRAIEDNGMMDRPADEQKKIGDLLAKLN
ncbi:MAG TPA: xylose isomerase, partial [Parafilimonas sp.]|nr:xylose isomerase [Parafilimonas sp.]